jgi:aminoglycoside phosphotransferase
MLGREGRTMIMWHINLLMASAAVSNLSDSDDRQWFLISTIPAVGYILAGLAIWLVANRRAIRNRQVSLRSLLILIGVLSPGLAMLRLVYWPYSLWR